jgi:hypothetical protein
MAFLRLVDEHDVDWLVAVEGTCLNCLLKEEDMYVDSYCPKQTRNINSVEEKVKGLHLLALYHQRRRCCLDRRDA